MLLYNKLRTRYDELILIDDLSVSGGGSRPILNYYNHQRAIQGKKVALIRLVLKNSMIKLLVLALSSDTIIINSVICFKYWLVILVAHFKKDIIIYVHDSAPHIEPFAKRYPSKFKHFLRLLQKRKVAFVSEWQAEYFLKQVSIPRYKVIYNNIIFPYEKPAENVVTIAMVAYQNGYKNVPFFSKVADEAYRQNLSYKFIWVGGQADDSNFYHSPHVEWLGNQEQVMDILNNVDVFLFTSHEDSFPLVFAEALFKGKRIVSYIENGFAAHIESLPGCKIYNSFDEKLVLNIIDEILKESVDINKHKQLAGHLCSIENFESRLDQLKSL